MSGPSKVIGGRFFVRNVGLNLAGQILPFIVGLAAIPLVLQNVGATAYGILSLSIMVVGYFGLFDLGLGAAATKLIAEAAGAGERHRIPDLFWTSLLLMFIFGGIGSVLIKTLSVWFVQNLFNVPPDLSGEALLSFNWLALALPFVISLGSLRGSLAAVHRFDLVNGIGVPAGIFSSVGPLLVLPFSSRPSHLVAVMVAARLIEWTTTLLCCVLAIPELQSRCRFSGTAMTSMLRFGGWVTVSNIIGPIMTYFDRFLIGAMISVTAVSYYFVPYQIGTKMLVIPGAIGGVAFAAFSSTFRLDPARTAHLFERVTLAVLCSMFPLALIIVVLAPDILTLWVGPEFAINSTTVLRLLTIGTFVNGLAQMSSNVVVAAHRPDLSAKLHLAEAPFYCLFLWWVLPAYGISGAAMAWALRVSVDAAVLFVMTWQLLPAARTAILRTVALAAVASLALCSSFLLASDVTAFSFLGAALPISVAGTWMFVLNDDEKALVKNYLGGIVTVAARLRGARP